MKVTLISHGFEIVGCEHCEKKVYHLDVGLMPETEQDKKTCENFFNELLKDKPNKIKATSLASSSIIFTA